MDKLFWKIYDKDINDSEIIQDLEDLEYAKNKPEFDINLCYNCYGCETLLMSAVCCNRVKLIEYFLAYPVLKINYKNSFNTTALHMSCSCKSSIPILKLFLDHRDIDVNIQNSDGWIALHNACLHEHKEHVIELLLDARVHIMIRSKGEQTARDVAIFWEYLGIANMLKKVLHTSLLRIPNELLVHDIVRMIIEEYA